MFAAISTMAKEMQSRKWFWFAILFRIFSYVVNADRISDRYICNRWAFTVGTAVGYRVIELVMVFLLFRPDPYKDQKVYSKGICSGVESKWYIIEGLDL